MTRECILDYIDLPLSFQVQLHALSIPGNHFMQDILRARYLMFIELKQLAVTELKNLPGSFRC